MIAVSSMHNARIKAIRALKHRKERTRTGLFWIEGVRAVAEAAQLGAAIELLVVARSLLASQFGAALVDRLERDGCPTLEVTSAVFDSLAARDVGQGVGAVLRQRWLALDNVRPEGSWVALEATQYPGNIGTILRTADAVGGRGVILLGATADPYDPQCIRASVGAIFGQRLVRAGVAEFADWKRRSNAVVVGTSPAAPEDYRRADYAPPAVLLMGGERAGLSAELRSLCDVMVGIPMVGRNDSLNLAVATSLVLYELFERGRSIRE